MANKLKPLRITFTPKEREMIRETIHFKSGLTERRAIIATISTEVWDAKVREMRIKRAKKNG